MHTDERVEEQFGIKKEIFQQAEYGKSIMGGVDPREIRRDAASLGFKSCSVKLEWFLGQGDVMHGQSFADAATIETFLRSVAPLSDHLFKYVQVIFVK